MFNRSTGGSTSQLRLRVALALPRLAKSSRRFTTTLRLLSLSLLLGACGSSQAAPVTNYAVTPNATVTRVIDGDTIEADVGSTSEHIRFIGIDTPETVHPTKPVGCYGKEASSYTKKLLPAGTKVRIEVDVEERDVYGRLLAYVYRAQDNLFVNDDLAAKGYAQLLTIAPNVAHSEDFTAAVKEARDSNLGLWQACD